MPLTVSTPFPPLPAQVVVLVEAGARMDAININKESPFDMAIKFGHDAVVRYFLNPSLRDDLLGREAARWEAAHGAPVGGSGL